MTSRANQSWPSDHYAAEIDADTIQSVTSNYEAAKIRRDELTARMATCSAALKLFPHDSMNLTPDAVKSTPEWKAAKRAVDEAFATLRAFNAKFTKAFKAEIRADRKF